MGKHTRSEFWESLFMVLAFALLMVFCMIVGVSPFGVDTTSTP